MIWVSGDQLRSASLKSTSDEAWQPGDPGRVPISWTEPALRGQDATWGGPEALSNP